MSKLIICSVCGGMNIQTERRPDGDRHCLSCGSRWKIGDEQVSKKPTLFDRLTASPEVLAENLLHCIFYPHGRRWISTVIVWKEFEDKKEAYAATVAKLKEVCDE